MTVESLNIPDYSDPDTLIKDAWIDSKNIKDAHSRLLIRIQLIALATRYNDLLLLDGEAYEEEGELED